MEIGVFSFADRERLMGRFRKRPGAEMRAHTLKGIAGNLGLGDVQTIAAELEAQLRTKISEKEVETTRARLEAALRITLAAVHSIPRHVNTRQDGVVPVSVPKDLDSVLEKLSWLIEEHDSEALAVFESLRPLLESMAGREEAKRLADLLLEYDFCAALPFVTNLQQKIRPSRKGCEAGGGAE